LAREGSDLSGKNLPGQLERGVGDGEGFVIGRDDRMRRITLSAHTTHGSTSELM
jgi:hypothetical protein